MYAHYCFLLSSILFETYLPRIMRIVIYIIIKLSWIYPQGTNCVYNPQLRIAYPRASRQGAATEHDMGLY